MSSIDIALHRGVGGMRAEQAGEGREKERRGRQGSLLKL